MTSTIELLFLTYNRLGIVSRCFKSMLSGLLANENVSWRILDNGSGDNTPEWLLRLANRYPRITVTLSGVNLGVAGGRQRLLEQAQGDIIAFLDSDVEALTPGWMHPFVTILDNPQVGAVGPGGHFLSPDWQRFVPTKAGGEVDVISGYCQFVRRSALEGFRFDPFFNPYWHEDSDMCLWLRSKGYLIWNANLGQVRHIFSNSAHANHEDERRKHHYLAQKWAGKQLVRFEREKKEADG